MTAPSLRAALELAVEDGLAGMTIEAVAARAGVDVEVAVDVLIGPMIYRALIPGAGPAALAGLPESVFALVSEGLTAPRG